MRLLALTIAPLLIAATARADAPPAGLTVDTSHSVMIYHLIHKLHKFDGVSKQVSGKARLLPGGKVQVVITVPVASFDSQNVNRDAHMKETVEAARFPNVELKGVGDLPLPASFPATVDKIFKGQISFHGVQSQLDVPVKVIFDSPDKVRAEASLSLSLDAFKIERPSLLFVKVDDAMKVDVVIAFTK